jgi:hypothetical protein
MPVRNVDGSFTTQKRDYRGLKEDKFIKEMPIYPRNLKLYNSKISRCDFK